MCHSSSSWELILLLNSRVHFQSLGDRIGMRMRKLESGTIHVRFVHLRAPSDTNKVHSSLFPQHLTKQRYPTPSKPSHRSIRIQIAPTHILEHRPASGASKVYPRVTLPLLAYWRSRCNKENIDPQESHVGASIPAAIGAGTPYSTYSDDYAHVEALPSSTTTTSGYEA